jgi:hypothetical protein
MYIITSNGVQYPRMVPVLLSFLCGFLLHSPFGRLFVILRQWEGVSFSRGCGGTINVCAVVSVTPVFR